MTKHYKDYFWKNGIPYGIQHVEKPETFDSYTYKIVMDPYRKHISIEKYKQGQFINTFYDSNLLNFRHLKNEEHRAWQKVKVFESKDQVICHLRDQDDRLVFKELNFFKEDFCVESHLYSCHDHLISIQKMFYETLKDPFNGVILYDVENRAVLYKKYAFDVDFCCFMELLEEEFDMQHFKVNKYADSLI